MSDLSLLLCHTRIREVSEHCGQVGADSELSAPNVFAIFVNQDVVKCLDLARRAGINLSA